MKYLPRHSHPLRPFFHQQGDIHLTKKASGDLKNTICNTLYDKYNYFTIKIILYRYTHDIFCTDKKLPCFVARKNDRFRKSSLFSSILPSLFSPAYSCPSSVIKILENSCLNPESEINTNACKN